jgi:hypothetical protein
MATHTTPLSPDAFVARDYSTPLAAGTNKATDSTTPVVLGPMIEGKLYILRSTVDAYFIQGTVSASCTSLTGIPIFAKEGWEIGCYDATTLGYVAVLNASGSGQACLILVK